MDRPFFGNFDVADIAIWSFWLFFAGLVFYLRREDRREGYPLESDTTGRLESGTDSIWIPKPKTYLMPHGHAPKHAPAFRRDQVQRAFVRSAPMDGSPIEPVGNPFTANVGPGSWVDRSDHAEETLHGDPRIVPLRADPTFSLARQDPDPRGFTVVGADRLAAGVVSDVWVDRSELLIRYLEVRLADGSRTLVPQNMATIHGSRREVRVGAVTAAQFQGAPYPRQDDRVTLLEEDKIMAWFGAGYLYATPERQEPFI
jgi:photosynthetic reaction center H subunit